MPRSNIFRVSLIASVLGLVWLSVPTVLSLHPFWVDFNYSQGYLIALIVGVLVVLELRRGPLPPAHPSPWGLAALGVCVLGTLMGQTADVLSVSHFLLPLLLVSVLWAVAGWPSAGRFWQPLFYLYFAIPFWDAINVPLRDLTTDVVSVGVRAAGIPAYIQGNFIQIPSGTFEVAGGCSGLHFFIVGLALAGLYGLLYLPRWRERIALVGVAAALALITNWLRVFVIIAVGHRTQMQHYLIVEDHYVFGWVLFLLVIAPVFVLGRWLEGADASDPNEQIAPFYVRGAAATGLVIPAIAGVLLVSSAWLGYRVDARNADELASVPIELPLLNGWQRTEDWADAQRPYFVGAGAQAGAWYGQGSERVAVYVANYPTQQQGREAVFYANRPWGRDSEVIDRDVVELSGAEGERYAFTEYRVTDPGGQERLVWRGLQVAGRTTASEPLAKLFQAAGALLGRTDAQVLVLAADCESGCTRAGEVLSQFADQAVASLYACAENSTVHDDSGGRRQ